MSHYGNSRGAHSRPPYSTHRPEYGNKRFKSERLENIEVLTNFFEVGFVPIPQTTASTNGNGYYVFSIDIIDVSRKKLEDESFEFRKKINKRAEANATEEQTNVKQTSTANLENLGPERESQAYLTRCVLEQLKSNLWKDHRKVFATDGKQFGVSPYDIKQLEPQLRKEPAGSLPQDSPPTLEGFPVCVRSDKSSENSQDPCRRFLEYRKANSWHIVKLKLLEFIPMDEIRTLLNRRLSSFVAKESSTRDYGRIVAQSIDAVIRSIMLSSTLAPGKSPQMFYLPPEAHKGETILDKLLSDLKSYHQQQQQQGSQGVKWKLPFMPLVGVRQNISYVNGKLLLGVDTGVAYFDRDTKVPLEDQRLVPLLEYHEEKRSWTIAGEKIGSIHDPILNPEIRNGIMKALKSIKFHVLYKINKGVDGKILDSPREQAFRNIKMKLTRNSKEKIIWSSDDEALHAFDWKTEEGTRKVTVCQYFREKYGIHLQFPKMPIISTFKGFFPIELLYQALAKTPNANSDFQKADALAFNDKFATRKRIEHIRFVRSHMENLRGSSFSPLEFLREFSLSLSANPVVVSAKLLKPPRLTFANRTTNPSNGSWNLKDVEFHSPATLNSFAVVDLTNGSSRRVLTSLFDIMSKHGMKLPVNKDPINALDRVTVHLEPNFAHDFEKLKRGISDAVDLARSFFFSDNGLVGFETLSPILYNKIVGSTEKCRAFCVGDKLGLIFNPLDTKGNPVVADSRWPSHRIRLPDGTEVDARYFLVFEYNGGTRSLDSFDVRLSNGLYLGHIDNEWRPLKKLRAVEYINRDLQPVVVDSSSLTWIHVVDVAQVECPALIFVCIPEKESKPYKMIKFLTNAAFGVQSQCLVKASYNKTVGGYLSNVAFKLNTKLANSWSDARAWASDSVEKLSWLHKSPTLIVGMGMSHSLGCTAVAASICLDSALLQGKLSGLMQMGHEAKLLSRCDVIPKRVMTELVMSLVFQYSRRLLPFPPQRILFYRDGGSEGNFKRFVDEEVEGIKSALKEISEILEGEHFFVPNLTYVVAQSDHGIRIVPNDHGRENVPFGTCVSDTIVSEDGLPSFLLISQHGLKGTSKAVYYKVLVNENNDLDSNILQDLTFTMSFQYGTATKSVRHVPVVLYSKRLAEQVISYSADYLAAEKAKMFIHPSERDMLGNPDYTCWSRTDTSLELQNNLGSDIQMIRTGILPKFGPFEPQLARHTPEEPDEEEKKKTYMCFSLRNPYRPHLAA